MNRPDPIHLIGHFPATLQGKRLDSALAVLFPEYSRTRLQQWIVTGCVSVSERVVQDTRYKVVADESVEIHAKADNPLAWHAQSLPLTVVYEDAAMIIINKPAGMVVHPAAGNADGTLVNALLHHFPELAHLPRAGIVHRLDKDTSGLLVVARTLSAHTSLVAQLQSRQVKREYEAVVNGLLASGGTIVTQMGRHPVDRKRMAVLKPNIVGLKLNVRSGKEAITHYTMLQVFAAHTHIKVQLETGRTHQIRVHMSHLGHPLIGDKIYGYRPRFPTNCSPALREQLSQFPRQALHARRLGLIHPQTQEKMEWESELPDDMVELLRLLDEEP